MEKREYETKELLSEEIKTKKAIRSILVLNTFLIIAFGILSILAAQQTETKVDYRYFNTTRSIEQIADVKINTYNGDVYKSESEFNAAISKNPKYDKRNLIQNGLRVFQNSFYLS